MTAEAAALTPSVSSSPKPLTEGNQGWPTMVALAAFVIVPFLAILAAVPVAVLTWGWGLFWLALVMGVILYALTTAGIGVGFHRYLTHGSFKAKRGLRIALAVLGSAGIEGQVVQWVADHRRHHAFTDVEGDPHSPWRFGSSIWGLTKGLVFAHVGWIFRRELSNRTRFAPDLLADRDIRRIDQLFGPIALVSVTLPGVIGGLITWSWTGALYCLFWAGLIRMGLLHHITWSINSICHVYGERPFAAREGDKATNFWPLAIPSFGESWHNLHHADPTCARHGVDKGQIDINARIIWLFEKLGWASAVRWPRPERLDAKRLQHSADTV